MLQDCFYQKSGEISLRKTGSWLELPVEQIQTQMTQSQAFDAVIPVSCTEPHHKHGQRAEDLLRSSVLSPSSVFFNLLRHYMRKFSTLAKGRMYKCMDANNIFYLNNVLYNGFHRIRLFLLSIF